MIRLRTSFLTRLLPAAALALTASLTHAQEPQPTAPVNQTVIGAGNGTAVATALRSPLVNTAYGFILSQISELSNARLRNQTFDAIANPATCVRHRADVKAADKQRILNTLLAQGLLNPADDKTFPGGLVTGVFPPVHNDGSACPQLPQPFLSAPGSSFGGHHSYPGGLPVHESNNDTADINLASEYTAVYGATDRAGDAVVNINGILKPRPDNLKPGILKLDHDLIVGAPLWHDWAKSIVFQWNADGSEFQELNIGGNGAGLDNYGAAGDARTGGHHILSIAETMKRGFSPAFVITQASAHSAPTSGNEFKVVNWLRAAAIIAQIDPVAHGYLTRDSNGNLRLPALRQVGDVDLNAAGQTNILTEYELHNLSDADFTFSGPAVAADQLILARLAPSFGYDPNDVSVYNNRFRNVVLSNFSAERLYTIYTHAGIEGVRDQISLLHTQGKL